MMWQTATSYNGSSSVFDKDDSSMDETMAGLCCCRRHDDLGNDRTRLRSIERKMNLCLAFLIVFCSYYGASHCLLNNPQEDHHSGGNKSTIRLSGRSATADSPLLLSTPRTPPINHSFEDDSKSKISILIVYVDDDKGQHLMAKSVAHGVLSVPNTSVVIEPVSNASFQHVLDADGIIIGSSVENANTHPTIQSWINESWDIRYDLTDKVGGAFVTAGGISTGQEGTLHSLLQAMMIFRMVIVGGDSWTSAFGASAITGESPFLPSDHPKKGTDDGQRTYFPKECYRSLEDSVIHPMFLDKARGLGARLATVAHKLHH